MTRIMNILFILFVIAVNLLSYFYLIPYCQKIANSHMNEGPFWGWMLIVIAFIVLVIVFKNRKSISGAIIAEVVLFVISILVLSYKLHGLYCIPCSISG